MISVREAISTSAVETWPLTLPELGAMVGVPIKVRPWWGSVREPDPLFHTVCNHQLEMIRDNQWNWVPFCPECKYAVRVEHIFSKRGSRRVICPAGWNYNEIKEPEIQKGVVVLWEGKCGHPRHKHSQKIEVLSVAQGAILLKISMGTVGVTTRPFLIGVDEGHPFVTRVHKNPTTVEEAFDWLTPVMVKRARSAGLKVLRQGDWHFIPTSREPKVDKVHIQGDRLYFRNRAGVLVQLFYARFLYRSMQLIYGDETRHRGQYVVYQTVPGLAHTAPIVKGKVTAPNHAPLHLPDWHIAVRNRSTNGGRSGVD